ncbi:hypothetical protein A33O_15171 [Nitratireductor aquibiodomus RA22]|uniref:Esterase n=1 Tax=Nitratireductor aquibiodomus RA22 TaxID=1189611 RepID=I5BVC7_9HYPH|nr:alpha/beta hydrolase-fold protein [Nitratireductor aquibiodomus]EIM73529.1 hypothetical protein A33O_15171 [Nitratireductor aquibiodomus RA22]
MIARMLKLTAQQHMQSFGRWRVSRRAENVREPVLRDVKRGYALSETHEFTATGPGGDHRILVAVPPGKPPASGYPVLFVTDANAVFGAAVDAARLQMPWPEVSAVSPFMIVGIGYTCRLPFDHRRRSWDLAPPLRNPSWRSPLGLPWHRPGGADAFMDFLTGPLTDALGKRYPVDRKARGICGLSLGGTFALYAYATRPDMFSSHAAVSPALWFDDGRVIDELKRLSAQSRPKTRVFIGVGGQEIPGEPGVCEMMLGMSREAAREIERIGSKTLLVEYDGENHQSTIIAAMPRIMREAAAGFRCTG